MRDLVDTIERFNAQWKRGAWCCSDVERVADHWAPDVKVPDQGVEELLEVWGGEADDSAMAGSRPL
mgnify:CR=1 FL=1